MFIWLCIIAAFIIIVYMFMQFYPPLGASQSKKQRHTLMNSKQYNGKKFANAVTTEVMISNSDKGSLLKEFLKDSSHRRPSSPLQFQQWIDSDANKSSNEPTITWFGHSAAMLKLDGKTLLLDPMLGRAPSPFPFAGKGRYSGKPPIDPEQLTSIDAIILSHDHYDHLDYGTIMKLKNKTKRFIVPLGVAAHLIKWGISPSNIEEHDWWDEFNYEGIRLACTPARHFSGRSLTDRNATLWCSWVIRGKETNIFFSGDSGYGPHFKEIGDKYGPFDLTMMECGQYNERWASIHMTPEQTVEAHVDVRGEVLIPIHWGAFTLSLHSWTDPVERAVAAATVKSIKISTPRLGQPVPIHSESYPAEAWWR